MALLERFPKPLVFDHIPNPLKPKPYMSPEKRLEAELKYLVTRNDLPQGREFAVLGAMAGDAVFTAYLYKKLDKRKGNLPTLVREDASYDIYNSLGRVPSVYSWYETPLIKDGVLWWTAVHPINGSRNVSVEHSITNLIGERIGVMISVAAKTAEHDAMLANPRLSPRDADFGVFFTELNKPF